MSFPQASQCTRAKPLARMPHERYRSNAAPPGRDRICGPSLWHLDLRIALSEGVHVLSAASMGALRAVEIAPFGMVGIGAVYRAYAEGRLTNDADVALLRATGARPPAPPREMPGPPKL